MPPAPTIATRRPAGLRAFDDVDVARHLRVRDVRRLQAARNDAGRER